MRGLVPALLASVTIVFAQSSAPPQTTEIENVVAFARLYGAVRYFYPGDAATTLDWNRFAVHGVNRVRSARDAAARQTTLEGLFTALGPGIQIAAALPAPPPSLPDPSLVAWRYVGPDRGDRTNRVVASAPGTPQPAPPLPDGINLQDNVRLQTEDEIGTGAHIDVDLVDGLKARVRLALTDTEARIESPEVKTLRAALAGIADPSGRSDIDVRLADVVVAWNRFRHFYPYWTDTQVDWDARLRTQLKVAHDAGTRDAHWRALRQLVNDAHDGHGIVTDVTGKELVRLPIQLRLLDGRLVITASDVAEVPVGAVLTAIDGVAASERLAEEVRVASGSIQQKETKAIRWMTTCPAGSAVRVVVNTDRAQGRETTLTCNAKQAPPERRAEKIAELAPGVWYVDLTRATMADVRPTFVTLAKAAAIIFDVRGYPTDAGGGILPHLIDVAEHDRWIHIPVIVGPYGRIAGWQSVGWNLTPVTPHLAARRVFLTDSTAISYAESVMGYVADRRLGTIIGGTTAGTNGDVSNFTVPGGFLIRFTGARVTRHDGQTSFHLRGVEPDIPLRPTFAGLRAGRDELLERALNLIQGQ